MKRVVIVGVGISGVVLVRLLVEKGYKVIVVERREYIVGNFYDYFEDGILIYKYGLYLLYISIELVVEFLSKFIIFFLYEYKVLGYIDDKFVLIFFNFKSIDELFLVEVVIELKEVLIKEYGEGKSMFIMEFRKNKNERVRELVEFVF